MHNIASHDIARHRLPHAGLEDVELDPHRARLDRRAVQREHLTPREGAPGGLRGRRRFPGSGGRRGFQGERRGPRGDPNEIAASAAEIAGGRTSTSSFVIMDCASGSSRAPPKKERAGRSCRGGRAAPAPSAAASTVESNMVPASSVAATGERARPHTPSATPCASPSTPRSLAPGAGVRLWPAVAVGGRARRGAG